jgi:diguanylate cyclase
MSSLTPQSPTVVTTATQQPTVLAHSSILMIDDEPIMIEVVKAFLSESGFKEFVGISDPTQALAAIQTERPDLLLLDLMMPHVNGFDILRQLRADPMLKMLPVVVMTSASDAKTKLRVLELGATDFLEKPVDPSELALRVRNTLAFKAFSDRMAHFDPLTGLPNRTFFLHQLASLIRRAQRKQSKFSLLQINLDGFNRVNENLGHRSADALLVSASQRLLACVRGTDSLGRLADGQGANSVSRLGGDEFTAVLSEVADAQAAGRVAIRIQEAIARPFHIDGQEIYITASIGIADFPTDGETAELLLRNAQSAVRESKRIGPNTIRFFSSAFNKEAADNFALQSQLHRALERNEFCLMYQPKVCTKTLKIVGAEALIRWNHPERGLVPPNVFIPLAEQNGLITEIGEWVLMQACRQMALWKQHNLPGMDQFVVSVNVAAPQLRESRLAKDVKRALTEFGIRPEQLMLELTESMFMQNNKEVSAAVDDAAALGVSLSLDDFGTGYSSLAYLKRLPLSELKIDRSFVMGLPTDKDSAAIVSAVIGMAKSLGLQVTAEGVETEAQLNALQAMDCDLYQGYLRSRPVAPEIFGRLLAPE